MRLINVILRAAKRVVGCSQHDPAEATPHRGGGRDLSPPVAELEIGPRRFHHERPYGIGQQAPHFPVKSPPLRPDAGDEVHQALAFDGDDVLQAAEAVIARRERPRKW